MTSTSPTLERAAGPEAVRPRLADAHSAEPERTALALLATVGAFAVLAGAVLALAGPSEALETRLWALAFAVALPLGLFAAHRGDRALDRLADPAPTARAWALAGGVGALALATALRQDGGPTGGRHLVLALAGAAALAAPWLAASLSRRGRLGGDPALPRAVAVAALVVLLLPFVPDTALADGRLVPALLAAAALLGALALRGRVARDLPRRARTAIDVAVAGLLALAVAHVPVDFQSNGYNVVHHHLFFLGPANDAAQGRTTLVDSWSQYGVGLFDVLRAAFAVVPMGFGGLALVLAAVTALQYVVLYVLLRATTPSLVLAAATAAVAAATNVFAQLGTYLSYPSASPLRFGLPLLLVAVAVGGTSRRWRAARLLVLAVAVVWSFEAAVYSLVAFGAIVLVEALQQRDPRCLLTGIAQAAGTAVAAVLLYTLLAAARGGTPDWGPYLDFIAVYFSEGLGALPVAWFSEGPLLGAAIFLSAGGTVLLALRRAPVPPRTVTALAGLTGFALASYTYYLGRSHPNNVLHLVPAVVTLGGIWTGLLLERRPGPGRSAGLTAAALAAGALAAFAWPSVEAKWPDTALAQALPGDRSLRASVGTLRDNPVFDVRSPAAVAMLDRHLPPGAPVLVLTEPDLTSEVLVRAGRRNVLPIAHPREDDLIDSSRARVLDAVARVRPGTLALLTEPPPVGPEVTTPFGIPIAWVPLQVAARDALLQRFGTTEVDRTPDGLPLVRLEAR